MDKEKCIEVCNSLLRGELSAIETYAQAINKFESELAAKDLLKIKTDHVRAVKLLSENVVNMGGVPTQDSGIWGDFAQAVEGGAKLLGENAVIWALVKGEEHGQKQYEQAINNKDVLPGCKTLFTEFLTAQESHINSLNQIQ